MSRSTLFTISLLVVGVLAAYIAHGIFSAPASDDPLKSKMYFAASILAFLAFIFTFATILYAMGPEATPPSTEVPGKIIFDACVKIIPPIITLIIGFYFGAQTEPNANASKTPSVQSSTTSSK